MWAFKCSESTVLAHPVHFENITFSFTTAYKSGILDDSAMPNRIVVAKLQANQLQGWFACNFAATLLDPQTFKR